MESGGIDKISINCFYSVDYVIVAYKWELTTRAENSFLVIGFVTRSAKHKNDFFAQVTSRTIFEDLRMKFIVGR